MADVVDKATRSRMMSGIRGKNTKPEILLRKALHARGFRFRLHADDLPGKPDIVMPKFRAVILVQGCFWHGHLCRIFKWPASNAEFWHNKINGNVDRDRRQKEALQHQDWRVMTVWECALRESPAREVAEKVINWLHCDANTGEISGIR
mgnify:CR=1 FL=1